jgi:hypothetical protein
VLFLLHYAVRFSPQTFLGNFLPYSHFPKIYLAFQTRIYYLPKSFQYLAESSPPFLVFLTLVYSAPQTFPSNGRAHSLSSPLLLTPPSPQTTLIILEQLFASGLKLRIIDFSLFLFNHFPTSMTDPGMSCSQGECHVSCLCDCSLSPLVLLPVFQPHGHSYMLTSSLHPFLSYLPLFSQ